MADTDRGAFITHTHTHTHIRTHTRTYTAARWTRRKIITWKTIPSSAPAPLHDIMKKMLSFLAPSPFTIVPSLSLSLPLALALATYLSAGRIYSMYYARSTRQMLLPKKEKFKREKRKKDRDNVDDL